ncbi:MAG: transaldolase [Cellvibrionales bacterium TMED122]|nr:MAG: transaldolase [Cellvibrionales bacterium TMED122]|tara:strand:- start:702 stop:1424 length:723 start_codon:yes stop_codon:yes gene_type:complete
MLKDFKVKIFADGADLENIKFLSTKTYIKGFTTNPSLMRKKGVSDYKNFALEVLKNCQNKPVSFEIFADDLGDMERQAIEISKWGENVNVKIPVTNTKGESTKELIKALSERKIICNITAILTIEQLKTIVNALDVNTPAILSIFAGRIADTGINPSPIMAEAVKIAKSKPKSQILWASTRELFNIFQAESTGCQIITIPHDIINKFHLLGKDLTDLSLETVKTFYKDAKSAGFKIDIND